MKKNTATRLLSLLLCLVMCLSMVPAALAAEAEELPEGDDALIVTEEPAEEIPIGDDALVVPEEPAEEPVEDDTFVIPEEPAEEPTEDDALGVPEEPAGEPAGNDAPGVPEEPIEEPVGDDAPGVPETPEEEPAEDPILPRRVIFSVEPANAAVTVYDKEKKDENGEPLVIRPEEDLVYLLLPGEYLYTAAADGYETVEKQPLTVVAAEEPLLVNISLAILPAEEPTEEPLEEPVGDDALGVPETPAEEPAEEPVEEPDGDDSLGGPEEPAEEPAEEPEEPAEEPEERDPVVDLVPIGESDLENIRNPDEINATNSTVMSASQFIEYLKVAKNRPTQYNNVYPYNCGYYNGSVISWDCWDLGVTILTSRGEVVNNYTKDKYYSSMDSSIGLSGEGGDYLKNSCGSTLSDDFTNIVPGEWLFYDADVGGRYISHVGYYIGNGELIEIYYGSYVRQEKLYSDGSASGSSPWHYHGKVPWISYEPSYLERCTPYPTYGTVKVIEDCTPYTLPCNANTAAQYNCTSTALTDKALKAGDTVVVTGIICNTEGNYWFKVDIDKNGSTQYLYAAHTNISSFNYAAPWVYGSSFPSSITGATPLSGQILTGGSQLVSIQGMVLNGDTTDTNNRSNVYNSSPISCTGTSYSLPDSAVQNGLAFQNLANGGYTLVYVVKVKQCMLTSTTAISDVVTETYVVKDKYFTKSGSGSTTNYLERCTPYPTYGTVKVTEDCTPYTLPCHPTTAAQYNCTSSPINDKALKAGDTVVVTGIICNTEGNYWFKVDIDKNGGTQYLYATHTNISSFAYAAPWVYNSSFPSSITGATSLSGSILTGGSQLVSIQGMVLNGNTTDTNNRSNVYNSSPISCSGTSYSLPNSAVDSGLAFQNLTAGDYTLVYVVKVKHHKLTSTTAISSAATDTYVVKDKCFTFGSCSHNKGTFMWTWTAHPHYKCYKCSKCGEVWADYNEPTSRAECESCRPEKPAFIDLESTYSSGTTVIFKWNNTARTTHYNLIVNKKNPSGEYVNEINESYVTSGFRAALTPGEYSALIQAYNSELRENDDSDWVHTPSDLTYFTVVPSSYTITYNANGGTGAPAAQTKTHDVTLTLSTTKPTRASASAGSYTVTLNANGGSVSPTSLSAARTSSYSFKNWNTAANGSGTSYASGASYTANASATLYAQWNSSTSTTAVTLPTPTRTGYTFKGWATSSSATSGATGSYTPTGNVTLYATWKANEYTISYNANGGTGQPGDQIKTHDVALTLSTTTPTRASASAGSFTVTLNANGGSVSPTSLSAARTTSYSFKNWNTAANGSGTSYASGASYTANASATLYAQWNSSTSTAAVTLPTPTRTGYTFKGWATSSSATSGATGSYTPTGNVTLYAIWEQNEPDTYTITYNANGGTGAPEPQIKTHGVDLILSRDKPTRSRDHLGYYIITLDVNGGSCETTSLSVEQYRTYSFSSWNTKSDYSGTRYAAGATYSEDASVTLYAYWSSVVQSNWVTLPTPTRNGFTFKGWASSSTDTSGTIGQYYPTGNVTLYAIWEQNEPDTYTISYDANGGTGAPAAQTKLHDTALTLSTTKPTRANASAGNYTVTLNANGGSVSPTSLSAVRTTSYTFNNWNTAANGSGTSFASGASYTANASATLYAQWNSSTSTAAVTLPTPTRTGYTFKGWATSSSAASGTTGSYTPTGNVTLYAIWEASSTYTISYDANGGTGAPAAQTKLHDTALTLSSTKPTRSNASAGSYTVTLNANGGSVSPTSLSAAQTTSYSFKNWNTASNGSGTSYASGASYTANASATLYAQWNSSTSTAAVTLPTPTRTGYTFKGWATSSSAASGTTGSYTPTGNVTLYATWQQNPVDTFTVTYNANGGTGAPAPQTKTRGQTLVLSTTKPTRANASAGSYTVTLNANGGTVDNTVLTAARTTKYTFTNWNMAADGSSAGFAPGASYTIDADVTLYAQWSSSTTTASVTLPTPTRKGYDFQGWATSSSATSGTTGSYTPIGNVTLYATWKIKTYTVSFDANGGTGAPASQTKTHGQTLVLSTTKPTRSNASAGSYTVTLNANGGTVDNTVLTAARTTKYTFTNWNMAADGSSAGFAPGASYTLDADIMLYAQWSSSTSTSSVTLPTPTRTGYAFQGWATSSTATSGSTGSYTPTGNVTIYAIWSANPTAAPEIQIITNVPAGVKITWETFPEAAKYKVWRKVGAGEWQEYTVRDGTEYTDTNVSSGTTYSYTVQALDDNANPITGYDPEGKTITFVSPAKITSVENIQGTGIKITWDAVNGAAKYAIWRKVGNGTWSKYTVTAALTYTDKKVTGGTRYSYTVVSLDTNNKYLSDYDPTGKSITYYPLPGPLMQTITRTDAGIKITWSAVEGAPKYAVYRKVNGESAWHKYTTRAGTSYVDKNVENGVKYTYTVRCQGTDGAYLSQYVSTKTMTYYKLAAPTIQSISQTSAGVKITWNAVSGATKYAVWRKVNGGEWKKYTATTGTTYTDKGVTAGNTYAYTIRCMDASGTYISSYYSAGRTITVK